MDRREYKQMMEQIRPAPELMERVLAEGQTERSRPMKHRIRAAGVAALAAALLMGTALAVNSGFLERYFKGDLSVVEPYIQGGESVSDGKFRLTLDSGPVRLGSPGDPGGPHRRGGGLADGGGPDEPMGAL